MGKLRVGGVNPTSMGAIQKVYVGAVRIWPEDPVGAFYPIVGGIVSSRHNDDNQLEARFTFTAAGQVTAYADHNPTYTNIHPWYVDAPPPPVVWCNIGIISNNSGGSLVLTDGDGVSLGAGVWFNLLGRNGFTAAISGTGSSSYTRSVNFEIYLSETSGGGALASTNAIHLEVKKL